MSRLLYHGIHRGIQKAAGVTAGILGGDQLAMEQGDTYNHFQCSLGEDKFDELCRDSALKVVEIYYCQEELSWVTKGLLASRKLLVSNFDENLKKKRLINHDSLMLKLQPGVPNWPAIYIAAEKLGSGNGSKAGIHINLYDEESATDFKRRCCLWTVECRSEIGLAELTAILKRKSPHYDVQHDNCWHYAAKTTEFVLQACIQRKSDGSNEQTRLQKELKDLESNLIKQHAANTFERVVNYVESHI